MDNGVRPLHYSRGNRSARPSFASRKEKKTHRTSLKAQNESSPRAAPRVCVATHSSPAFLQPGLGSLPPPGLLGSGSAARWQTLESAASTARLSDKGVHSVGLLRPSALNTSVLPAQKSCGKRPLTTELKIRSSPISMQHGGT